MVAHVRIDHLVLGVDLLLDVLEVARYLPVVRLREVVGLPRFRFARNLEDGLDGIGHDEVLRRREAVDGAVLTARHRRLRGNNRVRDGLRELVFARGAPEGVRACGEALLRALRAGRLAEEGLRVRLGGLNGREQRAVLLFHADASTIDARCAEGADGRTHERRHGIVLGPVHRRLDRLDRVGLHEVVDGLVHLGLRVGWGRGVSAPSGARRPEQRARRLRA
mmetsp:Transcript_728/g.1813  ORF Transcript_728/g.1813 Transcript_728/m.1813 type:complete len:222 (-) Transcript_728:3-668(-)